MSVERTSVMKWAPLTCNNSPKGVQLYYDFSSPAAGVFLAVTDLCFVWEVSLTRDEVVHEAHEQNCSIDPSESTTQLRTLSDKLNQSLFDGDNDLGCSPNAAAHSFSIHTSLKLPAPLNFLKWTFHLLRQDSARLADVVTFPLLREGALMKQQIQNLYQVIKDKDHVLSKLLDKIDNSAIDLGLIFPGITGLKSRKQRVDVSKASKHVPGMAAFSRSSWESGFAKSRQDHSNKKTDLSELLAGFSTGSFDRGPATGWTQNLSASDEHTSTGALQDPETDDNAIINVQPSKHKEAAELEEESSDAATESTFEDLADTPRRRKQSKKQFSSPESTSPRKGTATKPLSSSPIFVDESGSPRRKGKIAHGSSESESDRAIKNATERSMKTRSKLGLIGGKKNASPASRSSPAPPVSSNASTPSRKLGVVGGCRPPTSSSSKSPVPLRMRSGTPVIPNDNVGSDTASGTSSPPLSSQHPMRVTGEDPTPPPVQQRLPEPEETVEEKAQRKREELKRTQAQASAGAAKKKARRF